MKKIISCILSLITIMSMSISAFASETNVGTGSCSAEVHGVYNAGKDAEVEYSVDVKWSNLSFTYNAGDKTWDTETHEYKESEGGWATDTEGKVLTGKIEIINHSNGSISVMPKWDSDEKYSSVTMSFDCDENGLFIESAEATKTEVKGEIVVTPEGTLPKNTNNKIGQITVTISGEESSPEGYICVKDYNSLQEAVNLGGAICLAQDIDVAENYVNIPESSDVILELNGHTLKGKGEQVIENSGSLTIKDSKGTGCIENENNTDSFAIGIYSKEGTLTVSGGTIKANNSYGIFVWDGVATIEGGVISAGNSENSGGGTTMSVVCYGGNTYIKGGEFIAYRSGKNEGTNVFASSVANVDISGGKFWGDIYRDTYNGNTVIVNIRGGEFYEKPRDYIADGYSVIENDGLWIVTREN